MLVLTRKVGENIVIAGEIFVTVVSIDGGKVRLGVTAPGDVPVDRQEIHQLKKAQRDELPVDPGGA